MPDETVKTLPNRIALYLTAGAGLATALAPVVGNFDLSSTVGVVGGFAGVATVVSVWLKGWQKYEERTDLLAAEEDGVFAGPGNAPVVDDAPAAGVPADGAVGGAGEGNLS